MIEQAQYPRGAPLEFAAEEDLVVEASLFDLMAAFRQLLATEDGPRVLAIEAYRISVADRVQQLMEELGTQPTKPLKNICREGKIIILKNRMYVF